MSVRTVVLNRADKGGDFDATTLRYVSLYISRSKGWGLSTRKLSGGDDSQLLPLGGVAGRDILPVHRPVLQCAFAQ